MAMDERQEKRLKDLKYRYGSKGSALTGGGRRIGPGRHGPGRGMPGGGKPKNGRQTIMRLLRYLEEDKAKMVLALLCVVANKV